MSIYYHTEDIHNLVTPRIVVPYLIKEINPESVLDVGCGIGTWLKAFEECGIKDYLGLDGDHVDRGLLKIPELKFKSQNLLSRWNLNRKFDLVISLEVAEHLDEVASDLFVEMLVTHSDKILFSAAIPKQGGQNHVNEQWPSYWEKKFNQHGFYLHDSFRHHFWNNANVQWWYSQNLFLVTRERNNTPVLDVVHPRLFTERMVLLENILSGEIGVKLSLTILTQALKKWIHKIMHRAH